MESWRILLPLLLAATVGCRTARLTEPLERENRHLEDRIYCLEDELHEVHAQLESCRRENSALRRQLGGASGRPVEDLTTPPQAELGEPASGLPSRDQTPQNLEPAPPYQGPPTIAPPDPDRPEGYLPGRTSEPATGSGESSGAMLPDTEPAAFDPASGPGVRRIETQAPETDDFNVAYITLNPELSGGHNRDQHPGDDGIMVVLEPRNRGKQLIQVPGAVSIVVLDPALEGAEARVARWDFNEDEVANHYKSTPLGDGFHFALPWSSSPPRHVDLSLFVRLTTADGQQFIVDKPIRVKLPAPLDADSPVQRRRSH